MNGGLSQSARVMAQTEAELLETLKRAELVCADIITRNQADAARFEADIAEIWSRA